MKQLVDCKEDIHSCSKCGLCQAVCPIYKITGNDCTVSRGQFIMLQGIIKGNLKMSKTINKYLDLCLKCGACSKFCPSDINVVDIIALAKAEYFKKHFIEKLISFISKYFVFGFGLNLLKIFAKNIKSKSFEKKVIYFGGCGSKVNGNYSVVKILNACGIEVISPDFKCCGLPFFVRGDMDNFEQYAKNFIDIVKKYGISEVVTNCASCEKTIKSYSKWFGNNDIKISNLFSYIKENNLKLELDKAQKVTFHKPCNISNYEDVKNILDNSKNLEYIEMNDYDKCCGFEGLPNIKEYKTLIKLFKEKHSNIIKSGCKTVLTSCLGCEIALKTFSYGKYNVQDCIRFLAKNIK